MKKTERIISQIDKNIQKKQWQCLVEECTDIAINSHLIQQNGILRNITINDHLIELKLADIYNWNYKKSPFQFKRIGITKALSHKIFCNKHDTQIFRPIENTQANFYTYESFLLFSYRAVCSEISKKRIVIEKYNRIINANTLNGEIDKKNLRLQLLGNQKGMRDLSQLKKELEEEIKINTNRYKFYAYKFPKISVYASAVFSATNIDFSKDLDAPELENIYIHILPLLEETLILVGYHNNYTSEETKEYCLSWENLSKKELEIKLTGLFVTNIENWGISIDLFEKLEEKSITYYTELVENNIHNFGILEKVDFNLFNVKNSTQHHV